MAEQSPLFDLMAGYLEHAHDSEVDDIAEAIRSDIEDELAGGMSSLFWGDPQGEQLRQPLARILKDPTEKEHDALRRGAKGAAG